LGILAARYRDLPKTVDSVLPILMFLTPVIWKAESVPHRPGIELLNLNPFRWMLELVRSPLLGTVPAGGLWIAAFLAALVGWVMALLLFARSRERIVYWL
jgi:lipopolysaccharide transport system permease protein